MKWAAEQLRGSSEVGEQVRSSRYVCHVGGVSAGALVQGPALIFL